MKRKLKINMYLIAIICILSYFELGELKTLIYRNQIIVIFSLFLGWIFFFLRGNLKLTRYDLAWFSAIFLFVLTRNQYIINGEVDINILYYFLLASLIMLSKNTIKWVKYFIGFIYWISLLHSLATIVFSVSSAAFQWYTSHFLASEYYLEAMTRYSTGTISGLCVNYGVNAGIIAMGTGIAFIYFIWGEEKNRIRNIIAIMIRLIGLLFTGKRSPALLLIIAVALIYIFIEKKDMNKKLIRFLLVGIAGVVSVFVGAMFLPQLQVLIGRLFDSEDWSTLGGRTELYELAISMFKEHPLLGMGWNAYKLESEKTIGRVYSSQYARMQAHNIYLQLLSEIGIVGTIVIVSLFVYPVIKVFKITRKVGLNRFVRNDKRQKKNLLSCIFLVIFFLLYGLTGNPLYDAYIYFIVMLSCGALQAYWMNFKNIGKNGVRK